MSQETLASYDWLHYESRPVVSSQPDRLATVATLRGMRPTLPGACRVLELGCGTGGNLIPVALEQPGSTFVGIDLSRGQVECGLQIIGRLGLKNIELRHGSILDIDDADGLFDYILCHGVFSWVPPEVQAGILEVCTRNLTPNGVAYVSYNTYPGWHQLGMLRDILLLHAGPSPEPEVRLRQAREMLDFLAGAFAFDDGDYGALLKKELALLQQMSDGYLLHEHLDDCNFPVYFHQFVSRAAAHGLQYLGEAHFAAMSASNFPPEVENRLRQVAPDVVYMEQYMDVLRNRAFRQTLLCHADVELKNTLSPDVVRNLYVASPARPEGSMQDVGSTTPEEFRSPDGFTLTTREPLLKAALHGLWEAWPSYVTFDDLYRQACSLLGRGAPVSGSDRDAQELAARLLACFLRNVVELHAQPPCFTREINDRPMASPLARIQAESGYCVTDLRHEVVELNPVQRLVLTRLDGTCDRAGLKTILAELAAAGQLRLASEAEQSGEILDQLLEHTLRSLADSALLLG